MKTVTITELRKHWYALLDDVDRTGTSMIITRNGKAVGVLVPPHERNKKIKKLRAIVPNRKRREGKNYV